MSLAQNTTTATTATYYWVRLKASGQNYYDYIRDHIYKPASMTNSDSYELNTDPPNLAAGYEDGPNGSRLNNIFKLPVKGMPFGLGYSTVEDLIKNHPQYNYLRNYGAIAA